MESEKQSRKELMQAYKGRRLCGGVCGITHKGTGKTLLEATTDIKGSENRFNFWQQVGGGAPSYKLKGVNGAPAKAEDCTFAIFEELAQGETQTEAEYKEDLKTLLAIWREKLLEENLY